MKASTGAESCAWKGRRVVAFALGHHHSMMARLTAASNNRYKAKLLQAPRHIAAAMVLTEERVKSRYCREIDAKFKPCMHLP